MSLDDLDVVDALSIAKDGSGVSLAIIDGWDWADEARHLQALQGKLNLYIDFVRSGRLYENHPDAVGQPVVIDIIGRYPLAPQAEAFLQVARTAAARYGFRISARAVPG